MCVCDEQLQKEIHGRFMVHTATLPPAVANRQTARQTTAQPSPLQPLGRVTYGCGVEACAWREHTSCM